jgi:hypothetical protein
MFELYPRFPSTTISSPPHFFILRLSYSISHLHIRSPPHLTPHITPPYPQSSTPHTSIFAAFHTSHLRITPPYPQSSTPHTSISHLHIRSLPHLTPPYLQPSIPHTSVTHLHIRSLPYHDDDTYFPHLASISRACSLPHLTHTEVFPKLSSSFIAVHSPAIEPPRHTRHRVQQPHCRA